MFKRGDIVHHKVMGKGVVLNVVTENNEEQVEVRMENGHPQKFYTEELETDAVVKARYQDQINQVLAHNEEMAKKWEI